MTTLTWVGGTATWDGLTTSVWSPAQVPTAADDVVFSSASTYTVTFGPSSSGNLLCKNFTVSAGSVTFIDSGVNPSVLNISGSLSLSSGTTTWTSSIGVVTFNASSAQTISTNGTSIGSTVQMNNASGSWQLLDALNCGGLSFLNGTIDGNNQTITVTNSFSVKSGTGNISIKNINSSVLGTLAGTSTLTQTGDNIFPVGCAFTAGALNLNGYTLTCGGLVGSTANSKSITFNGGTISTSGAFGTTAGVLTTVAGTGTGYVRFTGASAKAFYGANATYNCVVSNDGSGQLQISGSNTFSQLTNGVSPASFRFTSATTQTITNWNVSGTAGNLVTITSSTAGSAATLSKSSGTVSSDYLSLKDSTATGGASWYAGANSTNVSGNTGWIFTASPTVKRSFGWIIT